MLTDPQSANSKLWLWESSGSENHWAPQCLATDRASNYQMTHNRIPKPVPTNGPVFPLILRSEAAAQLRGKEVLHSEDGDSKSQRERDTSWPRHRQWTTGAAAVAAIEPGTRRLYIPTARPGPCLPAGVWVHPPQPATQDVSGRPPCAQIISTCRSEVPKVKSD